MSKEIQTIEQPASYAVAVIDYNVTDMAIAELRKKHGAIAVKDKNDLATVQRSITELTSLRTGVEKKRVELKADALEFGKRVDEEARRVTGLLKEIEQPLVDVKKAWNDEQERIKAEAARKEKERVDGIAFRIDAIKCNFSPALVNMPLTEIQKRIAAFLEEKNNDTFDYQEFLPQSEVAKQGTLDKMRQLEAQRTIFEREQEEEKERQKQTEIARVELEAKQNKLREEQRVFAEQQAEARRAEEEKEAVLKRAKDEADRAQKLAEIARQKEENARLAAIEERRLAVERQQLELDQQKAAHEAKIAADKARAEYDDMQRKLKEKSLIEQSAPDMLTALESIVDLTGQEFSQENIRNIYDIAISAINKARGL